MLSESDREADRRITRLYISNSGRSSTYRITGYDFWNKCTLSINTQHITSKHPTSIQDFQYRKKMIIRVQYSKKSTWITGSRRLDMSSLVTWQIIHHPFWKGEAETCMKKLRNVWCPYKIWFFLTSIRYQQSCTWNKETSLMRALLPASALELPCPALMYPLPTGEEALQHSLSDAL